MCQKHFTNKNDHSPAAGDITRRQSILPERVASTIPKKKRSRKKNNPDPAHLIPPPFIIPTIVKFVQTFFFKSRPLNPVLYLIPALPIPPWAPPSYPALLEMPVLPGYPIVCCIMCLVTCLIEI